MQLWEGLINETSTLSSNCSNKTSVSSPCSRSGSPIRPDDSNLLQINIDRQLSSSMNNLNNIDNTEHFEREEAFKSLKSKWEVFVQSKFENNS